MDETFSGSLLFENSDQTVFLIDIPSSIAAAQETPEFPFQKVLLSVQPLEKAFASTEPKTAKARQNITDRVATAVAQDNHLSILYEQLIDNSLSEIRRIHVGPWCKPRIYHSTVQKVDPIP